MEKIYGYKEEDLIGLVEKIRERKNKSLTQVFSEYAISSGKAKGTVRNMYYALVKACERDGGLKQKYFNAVTPSVAKIVEFKPCETRALIKAILSAKLEGKSARSVIMKLSGGDVKLALRLQNKYRSEIRNDGVLVAEIMKELNYDEKSFNEEKKQVKTLISDVKLERLKREIDALVERLSSRALKENDRLKERVSALELENLRLNQILYGGDKNSSALVYFKKPNKDMVN